MSCGNECRILRGLNNEGELHGRRGHFDSRFRAFILCAVDDVGPVNHVGHRLGVETELRRANVRKKLGA